MTRDEIIERYCLLASEVWNATTSPIHPNDCFCGKGGFWESPSYDDTQFRNDGKALEFIERVVREALANPNQTQTGEDR